jgi:hypothetical protein
MSVCPSSWISWLLTIVVGLVAEMFAGTGIRDPVTTTSCRTGSGSAVVAGACCATAGIDTAARHAHIDKVGRHRFASDLTQIWFGHFISAPLEVGY